MATENYTMSPPPNQLRRIMIPCGFDPLDHLSGKMVKHKNRVLAFAHLMTVGDKAKPDDKWWIPMHHKECRKLFGRFETWYAVRDQLIMTGAIESDGEWAAGVRPIGFRWSPELRNKNRVGFNLEEPRVIAALDEIDPRVRGNSEPVHYHNLKWLERTTFDMKSATPILNRYGPKRQNRSLMAIRWFATGVHRPKVGTTGRLYSAVTAIPRRLRGFILVDGCPMTGSDVSNAQPLVLGLMASWGEKFMQAISLPPQSNEGAERDNKGRQPALQRKVTDLGHPKINSDLSEYLSACQSGEFYSILADALGLPCKTIQERNKVKRSCFWIMMGNPDAWTARGKDRWNRFSGRWPTSATVLEFLKRGDHTGAARALQQAEAYLMIREFGSLMMTRHPDIPMLMVHDAVMTTEDHIDRVQSVICDAWGQWGVKPNLKTS